MVNTARIEVLQTMVFLLNPLYSTPLGAKAAAHSAMLYFKHLPPNQVLINFHNYTMQ